MKKRIFAILCVLTLMLTMFTACVNKGEDAASESGDAGAAAETADTASNEGIQATPEFYEKADLSALKDKKLGITIQTLENPYWAGVMTALQEVLEANGAKVTIIGCDNNSATQIGQIENFVSSQCDLIMVHPADAAAVEDACAQARNSGIKVMCWDDPMTNTDGNWRLNNTDLGIAIGKLTGEFINEHYSEDNKAQVAVIGYPQVTVLLEREEGIMQGMEETAAGKYEVVANQSALTEGEAQTAMETILQKNPDCKVVTGIGAGAMTGADEALQIHTGGKIPEDMGVFTTDVTKQQLEQLADPTYPAKGIIGFEGSDEDTANSCAAMFAMILSETLEAHDVFRAVAPITAENAKTISAGMK